MVGIMLVTHGNLGKGLLESGEMIIGPQQHIRVLSLTDEGVEIFRAVLEQAVKEFKANYPAVLFLTDLKNATPYNEIYRYFLANNIKTDRMLSGVNLAMYVDAAMAASGGDGIDSVAEAALESGRESISLLIID